mgnify:CR=1 FL=1
MKGPAGPVLRRGQTADHRCGLRRVRQPHRLQYVPGVSEIFCGGPDRLLSYDPERARELLAEAGYPDGFSMTITVPSNYQPTSTRPLCWWSS